MFLSRPIAALAVLISTAFPLSAEPLGNLLASTGMTQEDVNIMVQTASELYVSGNATVGADTAWLNPETEAHGLAEILEVEANCVQIAYKFRTSKQPKLQVFKIRRCLTDGKWVLSG